MSLVTLPILLFAALIAWGVWRQQFSQEHLAVAAATLARQDEPVGNRSLTERFDQRTKTEPSQEWQDVFEAIANLEWRFSPLIVKEIAQAEQLVPPDQHWNAAPIADRFAQESEPVVQRIELLVTRPKPVWQPVLIEGDDTLLPTLGDVSTALNLLSHRFRSAFHRGDHPQALRTLELMAQVPPAFDWRMGSGSNWRYFSWCAKHRQMIRDSLAYDFWTAEELKRLDMLGHESENFDARWRETLAAELAMVLADTRRSEGSSWRGIGPLRMGRLFGVPATVQMDYVGQIEQLQSLRHAGTRQHVRRVIEVEEEFLNRTDAAAGVAGMPLAGNRASSEVLSFDRWDGVARGFAHEAMSRRWTRCAVAIKRFELQHDRWPESLVELSKVGLSRGDWHAVEGVPFGYQVGEDSKEAVLWTVLLNGEFPEGVLTFPVPPSEAGFRPAGMHSEQLDALEIRIR